MSAAQPLSQLQQTAEPLLNAQETQFWLDKAVAWGQADRPDSQKDTCLHLSGLRDFLQQLLTHINNMSSTTETMKKLPFLGQFLGRLCWNPYVTVGDTSRELLLRCLWGLYSDHPSNAVERKANQWIQKLLRQLATEDDDAAAQALMKQIGAPDKEYHLEVLKKMVTKLQENIKKSCSFPSTINQRCACDTILATSEACVPLVTCPEASSLIGALLQRPVTCVRDGLSEDFLDALSSACASQSLSLEEQALISLWCHSLSSLEEAVLNLLESVTNTGSTPHKLELQVAQSLLPKACAQHCSMFLVANDIFRSVLKQAEGNESVKSLIQTFTRCFMRELALLQPQAMSVSMKAFFPQSPQSLLTPLITLPSEMSQEAWKSHLNWLSSSLQRVTEGEEEGAIDSRSTRGHDKVFEAWFLLVECGHWVQVAVQLLVTSGPEDCGPLLWLLTFYHHPTNRWHHRALQLVRAKEVWDHLSCLFSRVRRPLPADRLQSLATLLSPPPPPPPPQQPALAPSFTLNLLVNFAVFCQIPLSASTEILQTVVDESGLFDEAACALSSLELRLNEGNCLPSDGVHLRIKELQNTITHMQSAPSPAAI